jgi:signal transduction histidine kinase
MRYQRLIEIARDLASTLDLDVLLSRIVNAAADLCNAEEASILLFDQNQGELYFQAATNMSDPKLAGLIVPVDSSIAGWIVTHREPIIIGDVQQDERHFSIGQATDITTTSLLGVPMVTKDKVVGALEAINKKIGSFNDEDQEILMTLGAQAAVAIENSWLFQQSDLISEFVHEIRTPLSSLNTATHLLLHPKVSTEKQQQMVDVIRTETSRLSDMASSFLDVARLESGRTQFNIQEVDPTVLLTDCANLMSSQAQENGLDLQLVLEPELPTVRGDYDKLKQAMINLLSNAIKYNQPQGTIKLIARARSDKLEITVSDNGIGIPKEALPQLFTKFYRVPGSEKHAKGTGLGLTIVKRLIEGHGGEITVYSQLHEGTTFTIHLPLKTP